MGVWKGQQYQDKGTILKMQPEKLFRYSWLSSMSGFEDKQENYSIITYELIPVDGRTLLKLTQENIPTEEGKEGSENNWKAVLDEFKKLMEV